MSRSLKLKDNNYWDTRGIVHGKQLLSERLDGISTRMAGYGQRAKIVSGDWNTACGDSCGFFMGQNLLNSPSGTTAAGWWYVIQLCHNDKYKKQIAFSFSSHEIFERLQETTWSGWATVHGK